MNQPADQSTPYTLVVDGDGVIRMGAVDILQEAGFRTFEAIDGDKALILLNEHQRDIVLLFTGLKLPGLRNGFEIAHEVAQAVLG